MATKKEIVDTLNELANNINGLVENYKSLKKMLKTLPDDDEVVETQCKGRCSTKDKRCPAFTNDPSGFCKRHRSQQPSPLELLRREAVASFSNNLRRHNHADLDVFRENCEGCRKRQNDELMASLQPRE